MKHTDYKFWYIKRDDNGFITECGIRFYEGRYETIKGKNTYIRERRLDSFNDLKHLAKNNKIKAMLEDSGQTSIIFDISDFGIIKSDEELNTFLKKEINKDKGRKVVEEQKI